MFNWITTDHIALFTFIALVVQIVTLIVFIWQTKLTRCTLVSTFRPKIILRRASLRKGTNIPTSGGPDEHPWKVDFAIENIGGTKALITRTSFRVKMFDNEGLPALLPYAAAEESAFTLQSGEDKPMSVGLEDELIFLFRHLGTEKGYLPHQNTAYVYFFGYVHYKDDIEVQRKMAVLRHYDTECGRFMAIADPDYEYAD